MIASGNLADKVLMIDEKASEGSDLKIVWSWKATDVVVLPPEKETGAMK